MEDCVAFTNKEKKSVESRCWRNLAQVIRLSRPWFLKNHATNYHRAPLTRRMSARVTDWGNMLNPPSMANIVEQMQYCSESTLMFVDPFLQPQEKNISTMLFSLMISVKNVGSSSCGRRRKFSQNILNSKYW